MINTLDGADFFLLEEQALEELEREYNRIKTAQTLFLKNLFQCKQLLYCYIESKTRYYVFHASSKPNEPYRISVLDKIFEPHAHEAFNTLDECIKEFIKYLDWYSPQWIVAEMI